MEVFKKLQIELPYDPAILLLDVYPKEMKTRYQRDICAPMFIAALFTTHKLQLPCPDTHTHTYLQAHTHTQHS